MILCLKDAHIADGLTVTMPTPARVADTGSTSTGTIPVARQGLSIPKKDVKISLDYSIFQNTFIG